MARVLEIDKGAGCIWIEFNFDQTCLDMVKCLPERSFDSQTKRWSVPLEFVDEVVRILEPLGFSLGPSLRKIFSNEEASSDLKVGALNRAVDVALKREFNTPFWVVGELSGYKKSARGKPAFFDLVEKSKDGEILASAGAVAFWDARVRIKNTIDRSQAVFEFRDGVSVRLLGRLSFSKKGRMLFVVNDLDPNYTLGEMQVRREQILATLRAAELAELNTQKPLERLPLRVALITSDGTDAQADFLDELSRSGYAFKVTAIDARMQGKSTEETVLAALRWVEARAEAFDVIAIVRGGGARADLSDFDTERIGRAVCQSPVKVVVGVGHHLDRCLLDDIALSTKTPTAAAGLLVESVQEADRRLEDTQRRLVQTANQQVQRAVQDVTVLQIKCQNSAERGIRGHSGRLEVQARRIGDRASEVCGLSQTRVLMARTKAQLTVGANLAETRSRLEVSRVRLNALDPKRVLERGFAFVRHQGSVLRSAQGARAGEELEITFCDGRVMATVDEVQDDG